MQKEDNTKHIAQKVWKIVDQFHQSPADDAVSAAIELYDIAVLLPAQDIEEWLSIYNRDASSQYLEKALVKNGYDRADAMLITRSLSKIDNAKLKAIMQVIVEDKLPNLKTAEALLQALQEKGPRQSGFVTKEIADLAYKLAAKEQQPKSALCMGAGADGFALRLSNRMPVSYELPATGVGRTIRKHLFSIAGTPITLPDALIPNSTKHGCGFIADYWNMQVPKTSFGDAISYDFQNVASEVMSLQKMLPRIDGRIICLIPLGWLYKTTAQDLKFKQHLIANGYIEAIVQLPSSILPNTRLPSALVVINTVDKKEEIQFINAGNDRFVEVVTRNDRRLSNYDDVVSLLGSHYKSEISACAPIQAVLDNDCNLDVKRFVQSAEALKLEEILQRYPEQKTLGDLVEIIRCQAIKSEGGSGVDCREISPVNIDQYGMLTQAKEYKQIIPSTKDVARADKQRVKAKDIIFTIKGALGKCALVSQEHEGYIASQSFVILRINNESPISEIELFRFLSSDLGQDLVERWATGAGVKMIKMQDFKKLPVPIPTTEQQQALREAHNNIVKLIQQKRSIESDIDQSIERFWS